MRRTGARTGERQGLVQVGKKWSATRGGCPCACAGGWSRWRSGWGCWRSRPAPRRRPRSVTRAGSGATAAPGQLALGDRLRRRTRLRVGRLRHGAADRRRGWELDRDQHRHHRRPRASAGYRCEHGRHRRRLRAATLQRRRAELRSPAVDGQRRQLSLSDRLVPFRRRRGRLPGDPRWGSSEPRTAARRSRDRRRYPGRRAPVANECRATSSSPTRRPDSRSPAETAGGSFAPPTAATPGSRWRAPISCSTGHVRDGDQRVCGRQRRQAPTPTGATWTPSRSRAFRPLGLRSIDCADATTCLIAEERRPAGEDHRRRRHGHRREPLLAEDHRRGVLVCGRAVAVGADGATVVSGDGGLTWSPVGARIVGTGFGRLRATSAALANSGGANESSRAPSTVARPGPRSGCRPPAPCWMRRFRTPTSALQSTRAPVRSRRSTGRKLADPRPRGLDRSGGRARPRPEHRAADRTARRKALDRWRQFVRVHRRQGRSQRPTGERRARRHGGARVRPRGAPAVDQRRSELEARAVAAER